MEEKYCLGCSKEGSELGGLHCRNDPNLFVCTECFYDEYVRVGEEVKDMEYWIGRKNG